VSRRAEARPVRRALLSGAAVALLAGCENLVPRADRPALGPREDDAAILAATLAVEHQAIAVYEVAAVRGVLAGRTLELCGRFRDHHVRHAEALVRAIVGLGGGPEAGHGAAGIAAEAIVDEAAFLRLAIAAERNAASAYLGAVPAFADRDLAKAAAGILGVETMHWAALLALLGENPAPEPFLG
jgi:hypothetical protein